MRRTNGYITTCPHCGAQDMAVTQDEEANQFGVCYHCGAVKALHSFNAKQFLVEKMRARIRDRATLVDELEDRISDEYYWLDGVDIKCLAKVMVGELYDKVCFEVVVKEQAKSDKVETMKNNVMREA